MAKAAGSSARSRALPAGGWALKARALVARLATASGEHRLTAYASAIAFRALIALVPLTLLGLALLSVFGLEGVWRDSIAPAIQSHATQPVYHAIDFSVEKIFSTGSAGLIAFAAALLVWDMTAAVFTIMQALNEIHDVEEDRSWPRRLIVAVGLAVTIVVCVVGSVLVVILGPRPGGAEHVIFGIARWPVAIVLLGVALGLLVRYAPAEHPEPRWASAGSIAVVGTWILATIGFKWWVSSVANFETAVGTLTVFLVLTAYVFTSSAIFLLGVQLDELLRKSSRRA
jgi:membrane protein